MVDIRTPLIPKSTRFMDRRRIFSCARYLAFTTEKKAYVIAAHSDPLIELFVVAGFANVAVSICLARTVPA